MVSEDKKRVLDPESDATALKALTHPLRIRLLGLLRMDGPATASELAAKTGESSASTSYHLRVLAKYAFVVEAEQRDGRERRWRAAHAVTSWSNREMDGVEGGTVFVNAMHRRQIEHLQEALLRHEADLAEGRLGREWLDPAGISDLLPRLTPESLTELWQAFADKLAELTARDDGDPRAAQVVLFTAGLPLAPRTAATDQTHPDPPSPGTEPDAGGEA
ncbi:winged helix-turn-helix domain-containing protein [Streptomyces sp. NPDC047123]|uniref:ArsR/SmtB family transcription factor n=1 Tax=Streptomyces sp. NPDC047123 TaxID=3155622 RepID=UPI0033C14095